MQMSDRRPMVAVVGTGAGGLCAARYLLGAGCDVSVFDRHSDVAGGNERDPLDRYADIFALRKFIKPGTEVVNLAACPGGPGGPGAPGAPGLPGATWRWQITLSSGERWEGDAIVIVSQADYERRTKAYQHEVSVFYSAPFWQRFGRLAPIDRQVGGFCIGAYRRHLRRRIRRLAATLTSERQQIVINAGCAGLFATHDETIGLLAGAAPDRAGFDDAYMGIVRPDLRGIYRLRTQRGSLPEAASTVLQAKWIAEFVSGGARLPLTAQMVPLGSKKRRISIPASAAHPRHMAETEYLSYLIELGRTLEEGKRRARRHERINLTTRSSRS